MALYLDYRLGPLKPLSALVHSAGAALFLLYVKVKGPLYVLRVARSSEGLAERLGRPPRFFSGGFVSDF